jgi:hypothetical protein
VLVPWPAPIASATASASRRTSPPGRRQRSPRSRCGPARIGSPRWPRSTRRRSLPRPIPIALCLPPRRKSEREPQLIEFAPLTDAKLPVESPPVPAEAALVYVIRPGVIKSMGKAIAQAGHAALAVADEMAFTCQAELQPWRARGMPGGRGTPSRRGDVGAPEG